MDNKENPLVSVLMPVYNGGKFLREAIDSVLNQTYTNLEFLIINDGSTDETEEIILSYNDPRIKYVKNDENIRLIASLNKGIELANGEYIARMDSDDVSLSDRIMRQVSFLQKRNDVSVCGTWAYVIDADGNQIGRLKNIDSPDLVACVTLFSTPFVHPSVCVRRSVLLENRYDQNAQDFEDMELWQRLAFKGYRMVNIPEYLLKYRVHGDNVSLKNISETNERHRFQSKKTLSIFLKREITDAEYDLHQLSYKKFEGNYSKLLMIGLISKERVWLEQLYAKSKDIILLRDKAIAAFLLSRWIVCCIATKKIWKIPFIKLPLYNPWVVWNAIRLLLYK